MNSLLKKRKSELEEEISVYNDQLSQIKYLMEEKNMKYEIIVKTLPEYTVYYKEGTINSFADITDFILNSATECKSTNPNIKCIEPDYCYVSYLDGEYKEKNIKVRYAQAVTAAGVPNKTIKFEKLTPILSACCYHKGSYSTIHDAYSAVIEWVEENGYQIAEPIRERYIDGIWNKESEEDWLTEIQVPIIKKD